MGRSTCSILLLIAFGLAGCKKAPSPAAAAEIKVAAASDLSFAFKELGDAYQKKTGQKVTFSFAATGLLSKQISEGAPFDLFAAANASFVDDAVNAGACYGDTKSLYARGHIVLWAANGEPPASVAALTDDKWAKIAIANPDHAPYGMAAKQAMIKDGVWDAVKTKVVFGENVQQTLQFAQSGNVDVAIVALSLASVSGGKYTAIDTSEHGPIDQTLVVCKGSAAQAAGAPNASADAPPRAFAAFLASDDGRTIMRRYGFLLPNETMTGMK